MRGGRAGSWRDLAVAAVLASPAAAATINFDEAWAPTAFNNQVTLGAEYSGQGVVFSGLGGAGGEVLDQNSTFGLNARSGRNFLAFNTAITVGGERLGLQRRDQRVRTVRRFGQRGELLGQCL